MRVLSNSYALYKWKGLRIAVSYFVYCLECACKRNETTLCIFFRELQSLNEE